MNQEIKFTPKEILEKDFKTSMRGYNADEVDKFLDAIIQDYEIFQKKIQVLQEENVQLKRELKKVSERQKQSPPQPVGSTNYDILQRLSNLEKAVFGNKL